jgi:S-formylglutathione hydrolase FrmB
MVVTFGAGGGAVNHLDGLSLVAPATVDTLALIALATAALVVVGRHRVVTRVVALCMAFLLAGAAAAAAVNAHYAYFPTLGALLGRRAADQASLAELRSFDPALLRPPSADERPSLGEALGGRAPLTHGVVVPFAIPGVVSGFHARTGQVYLPPAMFRSPRPRLPVIELLHGSPGSPPDWTRGAFADLTADAYAKRHHGVAPVLVMPDVNGSWGGDSECVDGRRGRLETYLTIDVRRAVVQQLGMSGSGRSWAIAGLSEGGFCALVLGLRHPHAFAAVGDFSGETRPTVPGGPAHLFRGSPRSIVRSERSYDAFALLRAWHQVRGPRLVFVVGRSDGARHGIERLARLAAEHHLRTRLLLERGSHDFRLWHAALEDALSFLVT